MHFHHGDAFFYFRLFLYSAGVVFVYFLNTLQKCDCEEKESVDDISRLLASEYRSIFFARENFSLSILSVKVMPSLCLNKLDK